MRTAAAKRVTNRGAYTAAEWELLNDFAAFLVHCDLKDAQAQADADPAEQPVTDGNPRHIDT